MKRSFNLLLITALLLLLAVPQIGRGDGGPEHQDRQSRPIELGVSGGNVNDRSRFFCCSGTLGALVTKNNNLYILSNNHVLARTIRQSGSWRLALRVGSERMRRRNTTAASLR